VAPPRPSAAPSWKANALVLAVIALLGTLPFWVSDLDLRVAALFQEPGAIDPWPLASAPLWLFSYQVAPLLVGLVLLGGLFALAAGFLWPRARQLRPYAVLVIALTVLGPGLLVNALFKDNWGRPRPHQTIALGGTESYVPPLAMGESKTGKSFPAGHSSAGFLLAVFFLIWRRARPRLAWAALAGALALGSMLGLGRMAAGDHFLSDVIWSGVIVYGAALVLYFGVLRIPAREAAGTIAPVGEAPRLRHPLAVGAAFVTAAAAMVAAVLAATPVHDNAVFEIQRAELPAEPGVLRVQADDARVLLAWTEHSEIAARILVKGRGFGLPGTRVTDTLARQQGDATLEVGHRGVFTEKDTSVTLIVNPRAWSQVVIDTRTGDIRVHPLPAGVPEGTPAMRLTTGDGRVLRDEA
jgi:membrane-associated PAP2 superfamily phosphatase